MTDPASTITITDPVTLTLAPTQFNLVLAALEQLPFRQVSELMFEIRQQVLSGLDKGGLEAGGN